MALKLRFKGCRDSHPQFLASSLGTLETFGAKAGYTFGDQVRRRTACIFRLELSYGSSSKYMNFLLIELNEPVKL